MIAWEQLGELLANCQLLPHVKGGGGNKLLARPCSLWISTSNVQ